MKKLQVKLPGHRASLLAFCSMVRICNVLSPPGGGYKGMVLVSPPVRRDPHVWRVADGLVGPDSQSPVEPADTYPPLSASWVVGWFFVVWFVASLLWGPPCAFKGDGKHPSPLPSRCQEYYSHLLQSPVMTKMPLDIASCSWEGRMAPGERGTAVMSLRLLFHVSGCAAWSPHA